MTASALVASAGNARSFRNGRQLAAWLGKLLTRRNKNVAAVALANMNARTIWALLGHDRAYESDYRMAA
jgi:transposase